MNAGSDDPIVQSHATVPEMMLFASFPAWGDLLKNLMIKGFDDKNGG